MKRIVVPLDGSEVAESVLPVVAGMARAGGASICLVQVAPRPVEARDASGRVVASTPTEERERQEAEGFDYLRSVAKSLAGFSVESHMRFGTAQDEILKEAEAFDADLIAVTTTGRSGLQRTLLGTVAERVSRRARMPVLLYRAAPLDPLT